MLFPNFQFYIQPNVCMPFEKLPHNPVLLVLKFYTHPLQSRQIYVLWYTQGNVVFFIQIITFDLLSSSEGWQRGFFLSLGK